MTYRGLAALIAKMPEDRKDSEALIFTSGILFNVHNEFGTIKDLKRRPPELPIGDSFDDDHPILYVED